MGLLCRVRGLWRQQLAGRALPARSLAPRLRTQPPAARSAQRYAPLLGPLARRRRQQRRNRVGLAAARRLLLFPSLARGRRRRAGLSGASARQRGQRGRRHRGGAGRPAPAQDLLHHNLLRGGRVAGVGGRARAAVGAAAAALAGAAGLIVLVAVVIIIISVGRYAAVCRARRVAWSVS